MSGGSGCGRRPFVRCGRSPDSRQIRARCKESTPGRTIWWITTKGRSMKTKWILCTLAAVALGKAPVVAAQGMAVDEQRAADFLVGTWQCADTVGDYNGSYTIAVTK